MGSLKDNKSWTGSFLLGIGIVGMLDGIVFHQLLQWHSVYMHTDRFHQIVSDGIFHLFVLIVTVWGALVLWNSDPADAPKERRKHFASGFMCGAGIFNFTEGIINHHLLQIHHVKPGPTELLYDIAYDLSGIILLCLGLVLLQQRELASRS